MAGQELLAAQLIRAFADIFADSGLPLQLRPYEVLVTSNRTALIELVPDSLSIHQASPLFPDMNQQKYNSSQILVVVSTVVLGLLRSGTGVLLFDEWLGKDVTGVVVAKYLGLESASLALSLLWRQTYG